LHSFLGIFNIRSNSALQQRADPAAAAAAALPSHAARQQGSHQPRAQPQASQQGNTHHRYRTVCLSHFGRVSDIFSLNPHPDTQDFDDQKLKNITDGKKLNFFSCSGIRIQIRNTASKNEKLHFFFLYEGHLSDFAFLGYGYGSTDLIKPGSDPDPKHCLSPS
jgi:hypothetical protein